MNIAATEYDDDSIRHMARNLRKLFHLDHGERFPIVTFIEHILCAPESGVDFEIIKKEEMREEYAVTNTLRNVIKVRQDVYERAINGNPRDRFTLCHELGHFFLHRAETLEFARGYIPLCHQPEHQANVFAAELLAPLTMIKGMSVEEISHHFGISKQSASYQKQKIDAQSYQYSLA